MMNLQKELEDQQQSDQGAAAFIELDGDSEAGDPAFFQNLE